MPLDDGTKLTFMATSQATYIKDFGETEAEQRFKYSISTYI